MINLAIVEDEDICRHKCSCYLVLGGIGPSIYPKLCKEEKKE